MPLIVRNVLGLLLIAIVCVGCVFDLEINPPQPQYSYAQEGELGVVPEDTPWHQVVRVIDGDTIIVQSASTDRQTVRLLGVDTPETVHPNKPVECFGKEASAFLDSLLRGQKVQLVFDQTQGATDAYGRSLAYVYLDGGVMVNYLLIQYGYAYEYTYGVPYKYRDQFKTAQQQAAADGVGLWNQSTCDQHLPDITTCNCDVDQYNCSDFADTNTAQAYYECCLHKVQADVHQLDKNDDGLACF